jgi:hypothetical protein
MEAFQRSYLSASNTLERLTIFSLTAFLAISFGPLAPHVSARGRSFPIEITGTIVNVDQSKTEFSIEVDEPACILTIAVGRDCKFKRAGAPAGGEVLRRGARVRVNYFSTIFTGKIAVEIESNPVPHSERGAVEKIETTNRTLVIRVSGSSERLALRWTTNARFVRKGKTVSPNDLRQNVLVRASYYSPAFERKYAVRIELEPDF